MKSSENPTICFDSEIGEFDLIELDSRNEHASYTKDKDLYSINFQSDLKLVLGQPFNGFSKGDTIHMIIGNLKRVRQNGTDFHGLAGYHIIMN